MRVQCLGTCYMPARANAAAKGARWERFEDEYDHQDGDIYNIPGNRLQEYLDTGNFFRVYGGDDDQEDDE